jgi:uncharacterized protein YdeI (YjbR/CyaY-like superfamily)
MATKNASHEIDLYIEKAEPFAQPILTKLRKTIHATGLPFVEEIKWGVPCFNHKGLVCMIWSFKKHAAIHFFKGILLADPYKILQEGPGGNVSARNIPFINIKEVNAKIISEYVHEAALINEKGIKVPYKKINATMPDVPDDMLKAIKKNKLANTTFDASTLAQKRELINYVVEAKKEETRLRRIEKVIAELEKKAALKAINKLKSK